MNRRTIFKQGQRVALAACSLLMGAGTLQSCKDDVLTGQPEWLGNSIYERLQEEGNYTTMLKLIDDLDQHEVLGHTGSKTLFVADDQAFQEWFATNNWGVRNYEQMTIAQKRLLLNNSMINNAYLIELMSNAKAQGDAGTPESGRTMRRETATTVYDSVYIMPVEAMPNTRGWSKLRQRGKATPILRDATSAPMIHFLPAFMQYHKISDADLAVLTNHKATSTAEAWVNGQQVVERDITCKNGYIHKVGGVIESSPSMAQIVHEHPVMSLWAHLMDRYSAPYYDANATREYNRIYNKDDSVYVLRYYSGNSAVGSLEKDPDDNTVEAQLKFDPGWNQYIDGSNTADLHSDAGVMIAPSNEALEYWWNHEGRELHDEYKEWDSIPDKTLAPLIDVNMLTNFTEAVPSKFNIVLNDAMEELGIRPEDVDSCFMACNGVVYMTNKVFMPAQYQAVSYPALAHATTMNTIYWAISGGELKNADRIAELNFLPYLLSMDSRYAMVLPTNDAMMTYVDPYSYGNSTVLKDQSGADSVALERFDVIQFTYDRTKSLASRVQAKRVEMTRDADGNMERTATPERNVTSTALVRNMLSSMVDQFIIVVPDTSKTLETYIDEGYNYFKAKGGSMLRVSRGDDGNLVFEGGWQMEHPGSGVHATQVYQKNNGRSYQVESSVPMRAETSVYLTLKGNPEFQEFLNLLENDYCNSGTDGLLSEKLSNRYDAGMRARGNKNLRLLDNYNYTVYIPTNSSIEKLQQDKLLPSPRELDIDGEVDNEVLDSVCVAEGWFNERATETEKENVRTKVIAAVKGIITDFVRYHIQDHSIAIGMAKEQNYKPYTAYESMARNLDTGRFYPIEVDYDTKQMVIRDERGVEHHVVTKPGLYNQNCCEYWFYSDGRQFMASDVMLHQIDTPLLYKDLKPWRQVVSEALAQ